MKCAAFVLLALLNPVLGHVSLTFPPARKYALDFLDTFRTQKPCGMPKGKEVTTILKGTTIPVTFHLGYPHRGGFKLELLDKNDNVLRDLTPEGLFVGEDDNTLQRYDVELPSFLECPGCAIRLERQALEWGAKYRFQSCADVDIISQELYDNREKCHNGGSWTGSRCNCPRKTYGDFCQYKRECENDADCLNNGRCFAISQEGTGLPDKQCFCFFGHFGPNCESASTILQQKFTNFTGFQLQRFGPDYEFRWRYLGQDKIIGVMKAKTSSYVALGWRPSGDTTACKSFPFDADAPNDRQLHPMDCSDFVIGAVREGNFFRVGDYYTRDRSTPQPDEFYGGKSDLVDAIGYEEDGYTVIGFVRDVAGTGRSDQEFDGDLHMIWAFGRADDPFYREDELKYHGPNKGYFPSLKFVSSSVKAKSELLVLAIVLAVYKVILQ